MLFSIRTKDAASEVEGQTPEGALIKHLTSLRHPLLRVKDKAEAERLFSALPRRAVVSGGGESRAYRVKWEEVGKSRLAGSRFVFIVVGGERATGRLGRLLGALFRPR